MRVSRKHLGQKLNRSHSFRLFSTFVRNIKRFNGTMIGQRSEKLELDADLAVDPTAFFKEITAGTSFANDERMQAHLKDFSESFKKIIKTEEGQAMVMSLTNIGKGIKDVTGFVDFVKMLFRLVKKIGSNPMVQFGVFLGFLGLVIALVAHLGPVGLAGTGLQAILQRLYFTLFTTALTPLYKGTKSAIEAFFSKDEAEIVENLQSSNEP